MSETYAEILANANQAVAETAATLADDPQRPGYHLFTAANWINDPNGPLLLQRLLAYVLPAQSLHCRFRTDGLGTCTQSRFSALGTLSHRPYAIPG